MTRKPDPINVFIVEQHNNVLNILHRGIGSKKIPYSNLKLLHYDAHPDLGVASSSRRTVLENPQKLLNECSIENWILPAVYAGHIDHVIWMRPVYCNQLGDRISKEYHVGYGDNGNRMMVDINDLYFINEGAYTKTELLENKVKFKLSVGPIHYTHTMCRFCYDINIQLMNSNFILDIDLDTFAPVNPFRNKFTAMQEALITNVYGVPKTEIATDALHSLNNQPFPFRLKHVRYPAKKCDGQLPLIPIGSIEEEVANQLSRDRRRKLKTLENFIKQLQFGIIPSDYEALKLFGLLISVMGFDKLLMALRDIEISIQQRVKDGVHYFTDDETKLLSKRDIVPIIPDSFLRQMENIFINERSKCVFFVLHEMESVYSQLKSKSDTGFYLNWVSASNKWHIFDSNNNNNGHNPAANDVDDGQAEDPLLFWHYLFSSCGFEWGSELDSLPHRPSPDNTSLQEALDDLTSLLNRLHSPIMITLARSCEDGYIRPDVIERVQPAVIQCLERVYENRSLNVIRYKSEDSYFMWPSTRRHGHSTKYFNELGPVSFRTPADNLENKDIL